MTTSDADTAFISAAMIYKLLKLFYYDAGCLPNNLTQSIYKFVFRSVPCFSHVQFLLVRTHLFNLYSCLVTRTGASYDRAMYVVMRELRM